MVQKRAVIYCRVSTDDQCCARQENDLRTYAERVGYQIVGVYHETASGADSDRPERKKVLGLVQARRVDVVLVTELSRWGRSTIDLLQTLEILQSRKVSLIAQTGLEFDLASPTGKLLATLMAGLAEFERALIRERVKSGIAAARAQGKHHGRRAGTTTRKVSERTERVLELVRLGRSYRAIASELGMSKSTVNRIVRDAKSRPTSGGEATLE
jgi:putative DNA-invertase from lambdoid prophage Rac